jgi:hypothetical protein
VTLATPTRPSQPPVTDRRPARLPAPQSAHVRHSTVREALSSAMFDQSPEADPSKVDTHLQQWLADGWHLVAMSTIQRGVALTELVHTFIWQRETTSS